MAKAEGGILSPKCLYCFLCVKHGVTLDKTQNLSGPQFTHVSTGIVMLAITKGSYVDLPGTRAGPLPSFLQLRILGQEQKGRKGSWEAAQLVKCLPCKHKDRSSIPNTQCKNPDVKPGGGGSPL